MNYLKIAAQARLNSDMKPRVGAVLARGGRILGIGYNTWGRSPIRAAWTKHAEVRACMNTDAYGGTLYVYRQHELTASPLMARPCANCEEWLRNIGVKTVIYTTASGVKKERLGE